MATLVDVVNAKNETVDRCELPEAIFSAPVKPHLLHEVVRMQLAKRRQGTAETKGRSDERRRQEGSARHRRVLIITYGPVLLLIVIASILFSILVAFGRTAFPVWMAAINHVTMTMAWMLVKRILPRFVRDWTEGAGFNIAYLIFFACTTFTLWNGSGMNKPLTISTQDYLKNIYELTENGESATTTALAKKLNISAPSVTGWSRKWHLRNLPWSSTRNIRG